MPPHGAFVACHNLGMNSSNLANIHRLASELRLPRHWLTIEADTGRIPCLRVGRRRLFNINAVRAALAERAALANAAEEDGRHD